MKKLFLALAAVCCAFSARASIEYLPEVGLDVTAKATRAPLRTSSVDNNSNGDQTGNNESGKEHADRSYDPVEAKLMHPWRLGSWHVDESNVRWEGNIKGPDVGFSYNVAKDYCEKLGLAYYHRGVNGSACMPKVFPFYAPKCDYPSTTPHLSDMMSSSTNLQFKRAAAYCTSIGGATIKGQCKETVCGDFNAVGAFYLSSNPQYDDELKDWISQFGLHLDPVTIDGDNLSDIVVGYSFGDLNPTLGDDSFTLKISQNLNCQYVGFKSDHECKNGYSPYVTKEMCNQVQDKTLGKITPVTVYTYFPSVTNAQNDNHESNESVAADGSDMGYLKIHLPDIVYENIEHSVDQSANQSKYIEQKYQPYAFYEKGNVTCGKCGVTCKSGYSIGHTEDECHRHGMKFSDGYMSDDGLYCGKCVACPSGSAYGVTAEECQRAGKGFVQGADGCNKCADCPSDYTYGLTPDKCGEDQFFVGISGKCGKCMSCAIGYKINPTCSKGKIAASHKIYPECKRCISCPSGYKQDVTCSKGKSLLGHTQYPECKKCVECTSDKDCKSGYACNLRTGQCLHLGGYGSDSY